MDGRMTVVTNGNRLLHFGPAEVFFKPLVGMAAARNEVVFGESAFWRAITQTAFWRMGREHGTRHPKVRSKAAVGKTLRR